MDLQMIPVDFAPDATPRDTRLYAAVQEYAKKELGAELNFTYYARLWAVLAFVEGVWRVIGVTGTRHAIDIPTFHITSPTEDREGFRVAEQATNLMYQRLNNYLADLGLRGSTTMIYVAPERERLWRRFLKRVGGRPASRYEVEIR